MRLRTRKVRFDVRTSSTNKVSWTVLGLERPQRTLPVEPLAFDCNLRDSHLNRKVLKSQILLHHKASFSRTLYIYEHFKSSNIAEHLTSSKTLNFTEKSENSEIFFEIFKILQNFRTLSKKFDIFSRAFQNVQIRKVLILLWVTIACLVTRLLLLLELLHEFCPRARVESATCPAAHAARHRHGHGVLKCPKCPLICSHANLEGSRGSIEPNPCRWQQTRVSLSDGHLIRRLPVNPVPVTRMSTRTYRSLRPKRFLTLHTLELDTRHHG